jgi:SAM-dependent methyltransferase
MSEPYAWVGELRRLELPQLRRYLPQSGTILDFGAGEGQQAQALQSLGFEVHAIDVAASPHLVRRVFDVAIYDGRNLPFPDASFDVVMSSNVLEHLVDLPHALRELTRVLKPGGKMLHVLPSSTWRLWSTLAAFIAAPLGAAHEVIRGPHGEWAGVPRWRWTAAQLVAALRPLQFKAHGEHGWALSELWTYRRRAWAERFAASDCQVQQVIPLRLWYTGEVLLGSRLSVATRARLSTLLGSATNLYVVTPRSGSAPR